MDGTDAPGQRLRRYNPSHAPAGHRVGLRQGADRHGSILESRHRPGRHVDRAVVQDVLVDLVGEHDDAPRLTEARDHRQLLVGEHLPGRVVRRVDHDPSRALVERGRELLLVERPVRSMQRHRPGDGARDDRVGTVVLVERLEDHDLVARVEDTEHRRDHPLGRAARDRDVATGLDPGHPVSLSVVPRERVAESLGSPRDRVLVDIGGDRVAGGLLDLLGRREVGESLRKVDRVVLHRKARHLTDHGLRERDGLLRRTDPLRHRTRSVHARRSPDGTRCVFRFLLWTTCGVLWERPGQAGNLLWKPNVRPTWFPPVHQVTTYAPGPLCGKFRPHRIDEPKFDP